MQNDVFIKSEIRLKHSKPKYKIEYLLHLYLERDIISIDEVIGASKEEIMETILKAVHRHAITRSRDGRYTTYLPDPTKPNGRRQIRRKSQAELYHTLLEFYGVEEEQPVLLFSELFEKYLDYKKRFINANNSKKSISPSTIRRYERDYEKYIKPLSLASTPINKITTPQLEVMLTDMIKNNAMAEKCASNVISYVCQAFSFARRSEYITKDPAETLDRLLLLSCCKFTPKKSDAERVLTSKEMCLLRSAVLEHEKNHPLYMPDYAIELAQLTGMRVGELAALHWTDIDEEFIHISYSEHRLDYSDKTCELIIGEPKNGKHRLLPLTDDIRALLAKIKALGLKSKENFIFVREDGRRYTAHDISCAIDRRASEAGIKKTSIHGVRRTVSSQLNTILSQKAVADMLGHSERVNEQFYNYSTAENSEKAAALKEVSSKVINFSDYLQNKKKAEAL